MFQNPDKPSCIDLILTNCPMCFLNSCVIETGLSDSHQLLVTVTIVTTSKKSPPKIITYRSYKYFNNYSFRDVFLQIECNGNNCEESFKDFTPSYNIILNEQVPQKKVCER